MDPVNLPKGVKAGPFRETGRYENGQIVEGVLYPLTLANGSTTTVFVPYSQIQNTAWIEQLIAERVAALQAVAGQG